MNIPNKVDTSIALTILVCVFAHFVVAKPSSFADAIYFNGSIYTVDKERSWAEAVAVQSGRILAVGENDKVMLSKGPDTTLIDLDGRMMMPGIHDGHQHLLIAGLINTGTWCHLPFGNNWQQASQLLKACAAKLPKGEWLVAYSYDQHWFEDGVYASVLDEAVDDRPLFIFRFDFHIAAVNSKGLAIALQDGTDETFTGGRIVRDAKGEPTGELQEGAAWMAMRHLPELKKEQYRAALHWSVLTNSRYGVVSVQETSSTRPELEALYQLDMDGDLSQYVAAHTVWLNENWGSAYKSNMDRLIANRRQYSSPNLGVDFVKFWLDGDPIQPHSNMVGINADNVPEYHKAHIDQKSLNEAVKRFEKEGIQVKMHASGDGAARMVLDAVENLRRENPQSTLRHELVHAMIVHPADRHRLAPLRVTADMSPGIWMMDKDGDSWPMKDLDEQGAVVTLGSDWPFNKVQDSNPFGYLADAILRTKQGISLETALKMMTINGAIAIGREQDMGSIEEGKWANLIILDRNLFQIPVAEIKGTRVLITLYKGDVVYDAAKSVISSFD